MARARAARHHRCHLDRLLAGAPHVRQRDHPPDALAEAAAPDARGAVGPASALASEGMSEALFDLPPATASAPRPQRKTSKGIAPGDVVEVDKKGRRFHALVKAIEQD